MARPITLKLGTNVPVVVELLDAFNAPSKDPDKFGDQVRLKVEHEGVDKNIYIPIGAALAAKETGILVEEEPDKWSVAKQGTVTIAKREVEGTTKKETTIHWLDSQEPAPIAPAGHPAPAAAKAGVTSHPGGCQCDECKEERRMAHDTAEAKAKGEKLKLVEVGRNQWAEIDRSYAAALAMATYHQCRVAGIYKTSDIDLVAAQAGCATILIHAQRTGMVPASVKIREGLRDRLEKQLTDGAPPRTAELEEFPGDEEQLETQAAADEPVPAGVAGHIEDDDLPFD